MKVGFVNIFGKPNAGKSTLLNALMGEKLAIVSHKVQTTRHRIKAILTDKDYQIIFSDLTTDIKDESVRISAIGKGEIKIIDVKVERRFTAEIREENINELQKKIDALNREMQIATDQLAIYDSKKAFIESLKAESVKYANQKILMSTNSPKEWNDLLKFIDVQLNAIYKGIREESDKRAAIDPEIRALKLTIDQSTELK